MKPSTDLIESVFGTHGKPAAPLARKLALNHIDSGFYRIPARYVRSLCVDGQLPKHGYEKRALPVAELRERVCLMVWDWRTSNPQWRERSRPLSDAAQVWIKRTCVNGISVWALHVWEPI